MKLLVPTMPAPQKSEPVENCSDRSLLRRYQGGCQRSATALFRRYAQRLHGLVKAQCSANLARRLEPDDLVQSVFSTFFEKAAEGQYVVPDGGDLWGLLLVIALHKIRSKGAYYGCAKRGGHLTRADEYEWFLNNKEPEETACNFLQLVVTDVLETMPAAQRTMMELRLEGYEVVEIAQKTERSKRTVERVLQDFRKKLDAILREDL